MKCLVVDSDVAIRSLIAAVLAPLDAEIVECGAGADALGMYGTHRPDVVLIEIAMDGFDGLRAVRAILAMDRVARVFVVTKLEGADLREAATAAGASGYVLKENLLELLPLLERPPG